MKKTNRDLFYETPCILTAAFAQMLFYRVEDVV